MPGLAVLNTLFGTPAVVVGVRDTLAVPLLTANIADILTEHTAVPLQASNTTDMLVEHTATPLGADNTTQEIP